MYRRGEYAKAIEVFEKLHSTGEADYPAASFLGAAYVKTGDKVRAIEIFGKLKTFKVSNPPTIYERKFRLVNKPYAAFSERAKGNDRSGRIRLAVEMKYDGTIGFIFPFATTSEKLVEGAIDATSAIRFDPPVLNGKPVTLIIVFEYSFERG
ncbi:MAG: hypothetical protein ACR2IH_10055 [Pyrinomonadaceae bacterium]